MRIDASSQRRRAFLKTAGAGVLVLKPETVFGSRANSAVEVGLVGCGSRGNWIAPFFPEFTGARIVALADAVRENLDSTRVKFGVESTRTYHGPDAFSELANSKVDAVVIETPTYYHPEQAAAAVAAGKHVFVAKPVAVDVPGCHSIAESGKKAAGAGLSFLVDFQTRARPVFHEAAARVHRGDIGKPAFAQVFYFANRFRDRHKPGDDPELIRVRNFYKDRVLGGDIIVEQNIHVIDVANWFLQSHPIMASGTGGRADWRGTPFEAGDAWDHFAITYWYPNNVHVSFSSHQLGGGLNDLCTRCFGIKGAVDAHYNGLVRINGDNEWVGTQKDDTFRQGAVDNVKAFIESIRGGKPVNNAETAVESNLTAILGRTAAYQHRLVSWDEMMKSEERWEANLKLRW